MDTQDTTKGVAPDQSQDTCRPEDVIPKKEKIVYGAADLFGGGQAAFISVILLAFFTDIIGIDAAVAGTVIMVSKIWDAIIDPSMGIISDNTRWSKLGRRKPYMIIGGALIPFGLAFLFAPITGFGATSKVVWMVFAYIVYTSISSLSQVPYMAMSSDISMDYKQRNSANTYKLFFDVVAAGIFYLAPSLLWTEVTSGDMPYLYFYFIIVFGFGLIFAVPLVVAGFLIKERAPFDLDKKEKLNFKDFFRCLTVKSYLWHLLMYVTAFLTLDMVSALAIYYTNYIGGAARGVVVDLGFMQIDMGSIMIIAKTGMRMGFHSG